MAIKLKITPKWIDTYLPFLNPILLQAKVGGRKKISLHVKTTNVDIGPIFHDAASRFTSGGKISGPSFTHLAGSADTAANNPVEMVGAELAQHTINPGHFYAVLDVLDYYGVRDLTVYLNQEDLNHVIPSFQNQLSSG